MLFIRTTTVGSLFSQLCQFVREFLEALGPLVEEHPLCIRYLGQGCPRPRLRKVGRKERGPCSARRWREGSWHRLPVRLHIPLGFPEAPSMAPRRRPILPSGSTDGRTNCRHRWGSRRKTRHSFFPPGRQAPARGRASRPLPGSVDDSLDEALTSQGDCGRFSEPLWNWGTAGTTRRGVS